MPSSTAIGDVFRLFGTIGLKSDQFFRDMSKVDKRVKEVASNLGADINRGANSVNLNGLVSRFDAAGRQIQAKSKGIVDSIKSIGTAISTAGTKMEDFGYNLKSAAVTTAAAVTLNNALEKAGHLEMTQVQLGAVYGKQKEDPWVAEKTTQSRELASKTMFSQAEVMSMVTELAHAGIKQNALLYRDDKTQQITGVGAEATFLAEIETGLKKTASGERTAYNFGRMVDDAGIQEMPERMSAFADGLTRLVNITHASSESLGETFKYAMPVVKGLGWKEDDLLLASGMAARAGMEGTMAGTHIKDFAQRMNPYNYLGGTGQKQLKAMEEFDILEGTTYKASRVKGSNPKIAGIQRDVMHDDMGNLLPFEQISNIMHEKVAQYLEKNGGSQQKLMAVLHKIFGEQGQDFALVASHTENLTRLQSQMAQTQGLHQQIDSIRDTYEAQKKIFLGNIANIAVSVGTPLIKALNPFLERASQIATQINGYLEAHPEVTKSLGYLLLGGVGIGTLGIAIGVFGTVIKMIAAGVQGFALLGTAIRFVFRLFGLFGGIAGTGKSLFSWVPGAVKFLSSLWSVGSRVFMFLLRAFGSVFMWAIRIIPWIMRIGPIIAGAFETGGAAIGALSGPIGWVILAIVGLVTLIILNWAKIKAFFQNLTWDDWVRAGMNALILAILGPFIGLPVLLYRNWELVKATFNTFIQDFANAGGDMVHGFQNGFWEGVAAAWEVIKEFCQGVLNIVLAMFGIASPSRVMHEIGVNLLEGFINGFNTLASSVGDTLRQPFNDFLGWITSMPGKAWEAGKDMISSLGEGFKSVNLPMPHFDFNWGDVVAGVMPSMAVQWYKDGGMFNGPNVIGVGEAGPEAVLPLKGSVYQQIAAGISQSMGNTGDGGNKGVVIQNATFQIIVKELQTRDDIGKMKDAIQTVTSDGLFGMAVRNI